MGGSVGSSYGRSNVEVSAEASYKGASGKVVMDAGPLMMVADAVAVLAASSRSYSLRHWL